MQSAKTPIRHEMSLHGSRIQYFSYHDDKPQTLVMIHGFSGNHHGLGKIIDGLDDYRLIMPDLPGFGESESMTKQPHTVEGYATLVADFISALKLSEPPALLGHSFGTLIAANVAANYRELINNRLILLSPIALSPYGRANLHHLAARLGELQYWVGLKLPVAGDRITRSRNISRFTTLMMARTKDRELRKAIYAHHLADLDHLRDTQVYFDSFRSMNREGLADYADKITQKTLITVGAADPAFPLEVGRQIARQMREATLEVVPQVGHLAHFEAPEALARLINRFLNAQ